MYLKNALRGTFVVFMLSLLGGLFGYLMRMFLARKLTVAEFGLFYSVITVFMFISYFIDAGMSYSLSRKITELNIKKKNSIINNLVMSVAGIQFIVTIVLGVLIILLNNFLSVHYFHANASYLLFLGVAWILFMPILTSYTGIFFGFQKPTYAIFFETTKSFLLLVFSFIFIFLGYNYLSPAIAYVATNVLLMLLFYLLVKKVYSGFSIFRFKFEKKSTMQILSFGWVVGLSNFIWLIILQIDTLLITYYMGATSVGIYQIAITIAYLLLYITTAVTTILYPLINELHFRKKRTIIIEGMNLVYKYLLIFLIPSVIIIFSFPDILINLLFTSKYLGAVMPLRILAIFTIFCSITLINNVLITSLGKPSRVVKIMLMVAILNFVLNLITIPYFGLLGAACSTLFSFIFATIISSYELKKYIQVHFPLKEWLLLTLMSLAIILEANYLINIIKLSALVKLGVITSIIIVSYLLLLFLFRIVTLFEIKNFVNMFLKR